MGLFYTYRSASLYSILLLLICISFAFPSYAQLSLRDFVILGGNGSCPNGQGQTTPSSPGCGVIISSGAVVSSGAVGSYSLIKTNSTVSINGNIHSGGRIDLGNGIKVGG